MLIGMARKIPGGVIGKENFRRGEQEEFLFGDVLGHSFFFLPCFCYKLVHDSHIKQTRL